MRVIGGLLGHSPERRASQDDLLAMAGRAGAGQRQVETAGRLGVFWTETPDRA